MDDKQATPQAPEVQTTQPTESVVPEGAKAVPPKKAGSNKKLLILILVIVVILFVLPAIALAVFFGWLSRGDNVNKLTETIVEQATGSDISVSQDGREVTLERDGASFSYGSEELPNDFPNEVYVYENQKITGTFGQSSDAGGYWTVAAETEDSMDKVATTFTDKFADWSEEQKTTTSDSYYVVYKKGGITVSLTLLASDAGQPTTITQTVEQNTQ